MRHVANKLSKLFRPKRFTTIVMMLIIWTGVAGSLFAAISTDIRNRDYLKGRAQTIANALPAQDIMNLKGSKDDLTTLSYNSLKERLQQIRNGNRDLRFVYLLGQKQGETFFYVDSEIESSESYSPPGQKYADASPWVKALFLSDEPIVEGPSKDQWGVWVSSLSPVIDPKTGQTVAVVGVDTPATSYYGQIALYASVPLLLAAIPLAGLMRDIKLRSKEDEMMQLKNEFAAIASHELRSPLTGMMWAIQSLSRSGAARLNLEQLSMLGAMYHSVESSLATVNEILDFSIFDRGEAKIQRDVTDVVAVVKQVVATLSLSAREKRLIIEPVGKWPRHVYSRGDVAALKRAFMNVFSNAIKYSPDTSTIHITHEMGTNEHIIGVRDQGIGIPKEEQKKVLEGYYRATNATAVEVHGTGLGLLVTKKIVEQHGGRLWLESEVGKGTIIYIALPAVPETAADTTPDAPSDDTPVATNQAPAKPADSVPRDQDSPSKDTPSPQSTARD